MEEYDKNEMIKEEQAKEKKIQQFQIVLRASCSDKDRFNGGD